MVTWTGKTLKNSLLWLAKERPAGQTVPERGLETSFWILFGSIWCSSWQLVGHMILEISCMSNMFLPKLSSGALQDGLPVLSVLVLSDPMTHCYILQWTITSCCWTDHRESSINLSNEKVTYTPRRVGAQCLQIWLLLFPIPKLPLTFAATAPWSRWCASEGRNLPFIASNVPK